MPSFWLDMLFSVIYLRLSLSSPQPLATSDKHSGNGIDIKWLLKFRSSPFSSISTIKYKRISYHLFVKIWPLWKLSSKESPKEKYRLWLMKNDISIKESSIRQILKQDYMQTGSKKTFKRNFKAKKKQKRWILKWVFHLTWKNLNLLWCCSQAKYLIPRIAI